MNFKLSRISHPFICIKVNTIKRERDEEKLVLLVFAHAFIVVVLLPCLFLFLSFFLSAKIEKGGGLSLDLSGIEPEGSKVK